MVQFALRETVKPIAIAIELSIVLGLFVLMVVIGPFGTFADLDVSDRSQYWAFMVVVNWLQLRGMQWLLAKLFGWERFWLVTVGACCLASFPASAEVLWIEGRLRPEISGEIDIFTLYLQVLLVSLAVMIPVSFYFIRVQTSEGQDGVSTTVAGSPAAGDAFFRRIPMALGRELHAVQAEDHYVRIYTAAGNDLVLHRFSDAMVELDGLNGLQVHRSWWVAEQGIADAIRRERKSFLILKDGTEVPVSRTYLPTVREKGWLA